MDDPSSAKVETPLCLSEEDKLFLSGPIGIWHIQGKETDKVDCSGAEDSAYLNSPYSPDSPNSVESRKRKCEDFISHAAGAPLPYLIRPLMKLDIYDGFDLYNDYAESLSDTDGSDYSVDDESDQGRGFIKSNNVDPLPLPHLIRPHMKRENYKSFNLSNEYAESLSDMGDEDFVLVENFESLPSSGEVRGQTSSKYFQRKLPDSGTVDAESNEEDWEIL